MRTFVAIEIPGDVRRRIEPISSRLQTHLVASGLGRTVRWTPSHKLHLTLRFMGETDDGQLRSINRALQDSAHHVHPFHLTIGDLGCFPHCRAPRVLWLKIQGAVEQLRALQAKSEKDAVLAGFAPEQRAFSPHLTIGRTKRVSRSEQKQLGMAIQELDSLSEERLGEPRKPLRFEVNQLVLMRSVLEPAGAHYTVLDRFTLRF